MIDDGSAFEADTIYNEDCVSGLKRLPDGIVNTCVTSPPYYGLRDYGVEGQIGLEDTPDAYVARLVEVFREVRRVLRDDGTLWLNLGDSYASKPNGDAGKSSLHIPHVSARTAHARRSSHIPQGFKHKDLIGIPWRVAFALQADGWYLRQDIIWHKPNPMPESVTDRCTKAHEYIFLLTKSDRYYYDAEAIKEPAICPEGAGNTKPVRVVGGERDGENSNLRGSLHKIGPRDFRNRRSVWTVATKPYNGAHFATFPPDLIKPCILAGAPAGGLVLDPFMGSGTTAAVAVKNLRKYIGFELNPKYIALASSRIKDAVNEAPALFEGVL